MSTQIHPTAHVSEGARIGEGAQIGAQCTIGEGVVIGAAGQIGKNVSIGANVALGDRVIVEDGAAVLGPVWIETGVHLYQGARVGEAGPIPQTGHGITLILEGSHVMPEAVICRGVCVGPKAMIRPCAHVVEDVKPGWVVSGDPAKLIFILDVEGVTR